MSPLEHALSDGEDYELLFVTRALLSTSASGILIGRTTVEPGARLRTASGEIPLTPQGWEHGL